MSNAKRKLDSIANAQRRRERQKLMDDHFDVDGPLQKIIEMAHTQALVDAAHQPSLTVESKNSIVRRIQVALADHVQAVVDEEGCEYVIDEDDSILYGEEYLVREIDSAVLDAIEEQANHQPSKEESSCVFVSIKDGNVRYRGTLPESAMTRFWSYGKDNREGAQ